MVACGGAGQDGGGVVLLGGRLVIIIGAGSLRYLDGSYGDGSAASGARRSGHHRVRALTESSEPDTIDTFFPEEFFVNGKKEEKREK